MMNNDSYWLVCFVPIGAIVTVYMIDVLYKLVTASPRYLKYRRARQLWLEYRFCSKHILRGHNWFETDYKMIREYLSE